MIKRGQWKKLREDGRKKCPRPKTEATVPPEVYMRSSLLAQQRVGAAWGKVLKALEEYCRSRMALIQIETRPK